MSGVSIMMGESDPQRSIFYNLSLESFVPSEHPLRRIRPWIDDGSIRRICRPLYSKLGRPSIPPEQLFLALIGGYLLGIPSERKLVMELQCNMALRWFVGLNLDQDAWDASTFSQNRRRRFDESSVLAQRCRKKIEELFGEAKDWHGMRRFRRRGLLRVREETLLIGWVLNLKRLAVALEPAVQPT